MHSRTRTERIGSARTERIGSGIGVHGCKVCRSARGTHAPGMRAGLERLEVQALARDLVSHAHAERTWPPATRRSVTTAIGAGAVQMLLLMPPCARLGTMGARWATNTRTTPHWRKPAPAAERRARGVAG